MQVRKYIEILMALIHSNVFKALSDPNRLKILDNLCQNDCESTVGDIAKCCDVDFSVVSRHLKILRDAGILQSNKKGQSVHHHINRKEVVELLRNVANRIELESGCMFNK